MCQFVAFGNTEQLHNNIPVVVCRSTSCSTSFNLARICSSEDILTAPSSRGFDLALCVAVLQFVGRFAWFCCKRASRWSVSRFAMENV